MLNLIKTLRQRSEEDKLSDFLSCGKTLNSKIMYQEKNFCFQNLKIFKLGTQNPTESSEM